MIVLLLCGMGALSVAKDGWVDTDDGAGVVPIVALVAIGLAGLRWRPEQGAAPVRPVSERLAHVIHVTAAGSTTLAVTQPHLDLIGPIMTLALLGAYLALWGYRTLALLRTVVLLSALTWQPAASFLHSVIRSSLEQPSNLLYGRIAQLPLLSVGEEPWRLFSAQLHRGSLVVITTIALAVAANRWRLSVRTVIDLAATVTLALTLHHVLVLASPIHQYERSGVTQLATNPTLEIAISVLAVMVLSVVRWHRLRREGIASVEDRRPPTIVDDRDPVIFSNADTRVTPSVTAMLLTGIVPLMALALLV